VSSNLSVDRFAQAAPEALREAMQTQVANFIALAIFVLQLLLRRRCFCWLIVMLLFLSF
jgi:hypothetical protein